MRSFIQKLASGLALALAALALLGLPALTSCSGGGGGDTAVTGVAVSARSMQLVAGDSAPLSATVAPGDATNKSVRWSSSSTSIATITGEGAAVTVNALAAGSSTITVESAADPSKKDACQVTVVPAVPATGVSLDRQGMSLMVGSSGALRATVAPPTATKTSVTWESSAPDVAAVEGSGLSVSVKALKLGNAVITVTTADGGHKADCAVVVAATQSVPVEGVSLDKVSTVLVAGGAGALMATASPAGATNQSVTWETSNPAAVTITGGGRIVTINAVAVGESTITAKSAEDPAKAASCAVRVVADGVRATRLLLPGGPAIRPDWQTKLTADLWPFNATNQNIEWTSANTSVATVMGTGTTAALAGVGVGTVTITARSLDVPSVQGTCEVTVAQSVWKEAYVGGQFGMLKNGEPDQAYGEPDGNTRLYSIAVDGPGTVHAAGMRYDGNYLPVYFRDGVETPLQLKGYNSTWSMGLDAHVASDGHVYIAGFEYDNWYGYYPAVLWRDGEQVPLDVPSGWDPSSWQNIMFASGVASSGGNVYVVGVAGALDNIMWSPEPLLLWVIDQQGGQRLTVFDDLRPAIPPCVAAIGGSVYVGSNFGLIRLDPSNPGGYGRVPGYPDSDHGIWALKAIDGDLYAAGWLNENPVIWKNHALEELVWNRDNYYGSPYAEATDVAVGRDGSVYVSGNEFDPRSGNAFPAWWKDGVPQDVPYMYNVVTEAVAIREVRGTAVTSLTMSSDTLDIPVGYERPLAVSILPVDASYQSVAWASSNPAVASVAGTGLTVTVSGLAIGSATITATSPDGLAAACAVSVQNVEVADVGLPAALKLGVGRSIRVAAKMTPSEATNQNAWWVSSDPSAVAVGEVPGSPLLATLTAGAVAGASSVVSVTTVDGGKTASCAVQVVSLSDADDPAIFIASGSGLYMDGQLNAAIGRQELYGVHVDAQNSVHAVGYRNVRAQAAYYRNGTPTVLPAMFADVTSMRADAMVAMANGDVYVCGQETHGNSRGARLWKIAAADGAVTQIPLPGDLDSGYYYSYANAMRVHNGEVYIAGGTRSGAAIWKLQAGVPVAYAFPQFYSAFADMAIDPSGAIYVMGGYTAHRISPDMSEVTELFPPVEQGAFRRMTVDSGDVYCVGYWGYNAYYWKNGERHPMEAPSGSYSSYSTEADCIQIIDGHIYIAGHMYVPDYGYQPKLWIDGLLISDDRAVKDWFTTSDASRANAILVKAVSKAPVTGVTLSSSGMDVPVGYSRTLTATLAPADTVNKAVAWASSDPEVAQIVGGGLTVTVNGLELGTATITATSHNGVSAECTVDVVPFRVTDVTLPATLTVGRARTAGVKATVLPLEATNKAVAWASSNSAVATVTATGPLSAVILGVALGTADITVTTADGGKVATCRVTVAAPTAPDIHVVGRFGLYTNGRLNEDIGEQVLNDVYADAQGNVHTVGQYYDPNATPQRVAVYYKNGVPTRLPMTLEGATESGAYGVFVAANGNVYVAGYEANGASINVARLWVNGVQQALNGVDQTGAVRSCAYAVRVFPLLNYVYVVGYNYSGGTQYPAVWRGSTGNATTTQYLVTTRSGSSTSGYWIRRFGVNSTGGLTAVFTNVTSGVGLGFGYVATIVSGGATSATNLDVGGTNPCNVFVNGNTNYSVGDYSSYAAYSVGSVKTNLPHPPGANNGRGYGIHVANNRIYVIGYATVSATFYIQLWIDGQPINDDRAIARPVAQADSAPGGIFVQD